MQEPQTTARTAIVKTTLANVSGHLGEEEIDALTDVILSATETAALDRNPLLDWDEYREVRL